MWSLLRNIWNADRSIEVKKNLLLLLVTFVKKEKVEFEILQSDWTGGPWTISVFNRSTHLENELFN
jgi:hypothetical protein